MQLAGALSGILLVALTISSSSAQRITTIQLDGVQYFISRMNPYSPVLNYFLAYQYCRSLGLQLVSFETKEKSDSITQYLINAGYDQFDFWTSGNKLGTQMLLWMNTGSQFNATFNNLKKRGNDTAPNFDIPTGNTSPQRTARDNSDNDLVQSCVAMKAPTLEWEIDYCTSIKDFICEQTRCYYYNYGSIPVSSSQGKISTTAAPPPPPYKLSSTSPSLQSSFSSPSPNYAQAQIQKYVPNIPEGIKELVKSLQSSTSTLKEADESIISDEALSPSSQSEGAEVELGTNGPYDTFHVNVEMHDDPAAIVDYHTAHDDAHYVSTIEPDNSATTFVPPSL